MRPVEDRERLRSGIRSLLAATDEEFVPPLTSDARTGVARGDDEGGLGTIDEYLERCLDRPMVGAFDDGDLVGFASLSRVIDLTALEGYLPSLHVEIIAVDDHARGQGIATEMYRCLLTDPPEEGAAPHVSTKTWSTNHAHLAILDDLGFECVERVPDDRGRGIDTVYYARER